MAVNLGKKEQLVIGWIVVILILFAIHFLLFQSRGKELSEARNEYMQKQTQASQLRNVPPPEEVEQFVDKTQEMARTLWQTVLQMNIILTPEYLPAQEPVDPGAFASDKAKEQYEGLKKYYDAATKRKKLIVHTRIAERMEHLLDMQKAYAAGDAYPSDLPAFGDEGGQPISPTMNLSFLGQGVEVDVPYYTPDGQQQMVRAQMGWQMPLQWPEDIRDNEDAFWSAIRQLYDAWDVQSVLSPFSPNYQQATLRYHDQLRQFGFNPDLVPIMEENLGENLPPFVRLMYARRAFRNKGEDETISIGRNQEVTLDRLRDAFGVELPAPENLYTMACELFGLEILLPLARRNEVQDVEMVELSGNREIVGPTPTPSMGGMGGGYGSMGGGMGGAAVGGGAAGGGGDFGSAVGGGTSPARRRSSMGGSAVGGSAVRGGGEGGSALSSGRYSGGYVQQQPAVPDGYSGLITFRFTASNENAVHFLYDVVTDPHYFKIESLDVRSAPDEENVTITAEIETILMLTYLSTPNDGLIHPATGEPLASIGDVQQKEKDMENIGKEILASLNEKRKERGIFVEDAINDELKAAGLPPLGETLPTPTPAQTTSPMGGMGGAVGGPGATGVPGAAGGPGTTGGAPAVPGTPGAAGGAPAAGGAQPPAAAPAAGGAAAGGAAPIRRGP